MQHKGSSLCCTRYMNFAQVINTHETQKKPTTNILL